MSRQLLAIAVAIGALAACAAAARPNSDSIHSDSVQSAPATLPAHTTAPDKPASAVGATARGSSQQVSCDIRTTPTVHGVQIEGVLHATRAISGEYNLVIVKAGGAGSSDIAQGGPFSAGAGQSATLGTSEIGLEGGGHYRATLILRSSDGAEICRRSVGV